MNITSCPSSFSYVSNTTTYGYKSSIAGKKKTITCCRCRDDVDNCIICNVYKCIGTLKHYNSVEESIAAFI